MNKCLTILLNVLVWDQHATPGGILSLFVCIAGGIIYQQAPMRGERAGLPPNDGILKANAEADEESMQQLIEQKGSDSNAAKRRG